MCADKSNPLQPVDAKRLPGLDGMRAISIALVLFGHSWDSIPLPGHFKALAWPYLANSYLGVTVFFVLSGYLITYLLRREAQRSGSIDLKGFYARRVLRIFPALYTYLLTICLLSAAGLIFTTAGDIFRAATFLTDYGFLLHPHTNGDYWFVGHFWTLSLEEQFYLLWPLIIVIVGIGRAWKVALFIVISAPCIRTVSYFLWPSQRTHLGMMLHCACDPIMMGCLAALIDGATVERAINWLFSPYAALLAALFVTIPSAYLTERLHGTYSATIGITLNSALIAYCILFVTRRPQSPGVRALEWAPLRRIGILSYSLYLWQQLFLGESHWSWAKFPLNLCACFVAAVLSNFIVERPFLKLRRRFSSHATAAPVTAIQPARG